MHPEELLTSYGIYAATFVYCLVGGLIPIFNTEAFLAVVALYAKSVPEITGIAAIASAAQMVSKIIMFYVGHKLIGKDLGKYQAKVDAVRRKLDSWKKGTFSFLLWSSFSGLPPFHFVSLLAGYCTMSPKLFIAAGLLGRFVRFMLNLLFPAAVMRFMQGGM